MKTIILEMDELCQLLTHALTPPSFISVKLPENHKIITIEEGHGEMDGKFCLALVKK